LEREPAAHDPLVGAWASVAAPYHAYWGPRFRPFVADALAAFEPGPGPLGVPGCGPGDEALELARRFPQRRVLATDPAAPMLALLAERAQAAPNLDLAAGRAVDLGLGLGLGQAGGVFSSFTLQLLPDRPAALSAWRRCLGPAGQIAVLFWPRQSEDDAWGALGRAILAETGQLRPSWEAELRAALPALGLELVAEHDLRHTIAYGSPAEAWEQLRDACSLQVLLRRLGPARAEACGQRWLADHGLVRSEDAWTHSPLGRLWILRPRAGKLGS
jgi:ubiquinone/menaquinone biosynthesis C-methylase UbiE